MAHSHRGEEFEPKDASSHKGHLLYMTILKEKSGLLWPVFAVVLKQSDMPSVNHQLVQVVTLLEQSLSSRCNKLLMQRALEMCIYDPSLCTNLMSVTKHI